MAHKNRPKLNAQQWQSLNECTLQLHSSQSCSELQRLTLKAAQKLIPYKAAMFDLCTTQDANTKASAYGNAIAEGMSKDDLARYYKDFASRDYTTWFFETSKPMVYRDLDMVDAGARNKSAIYRKWMEPQGLYYGCGAVLAAHNEQLGTITLFRGLDAEEFTDDELALLLELARHVSVKLHELNAQASKKNTRDDLLAQLAQTHDLTARETQVAGMLLQGHTNARVAHELCISESTLKKHVNALYQRLGIRSRAELAACLLDDFLD